MDYGLRLFHGTAVVEDVLEAGRWYHDFFGSWVYEAQHLEWEDSHNSANLLGGTFSMEMLSPRDSRAETPSARFLRRHGPHFLNVAFWVKDKRALASHFLDNGIRVAMPGGTQVTELPDEFRYFVPHPKDTFGTLFEFIEEDPEFHDPRRREWWSASYWRDEHPLGIEGLSHCTSAVADLDGAARFYQDVLGCKLVHEAESPSRKSRSLFFALGDTLMEVATPTSPDGVLARHMERHGPVLYAFTFKVKDVARVAAHIEGHGMTPRHGDGGAVELDPDQAFGGTYGFTEETMPGHPMLR